MFGEKVTFLFLLMPYVYHKASQNECVLNEYVKLAKRNQFTGSPCVLALKPTAFVTVATNVEVSM